MNMKKGYISKYKIPPKNKQSTSKFGLLKAPFNILIILKTFIWFYMLCYV